MKSKIYQLKKSNSIGGSKKTILLILLAFTFACSNNDDEKTPNTNPIDQLPPATQVGANTFGCLLDGEVFKPGTGPNPLDCVYQFVDGGYYFSLQANRRDADNNLIGLGCSTQNLQIFEGQTYHLKERIDNNAYGKFFFNIDFTYTDAIQTGELTITKLTNQIVSGTFWFDVEDQNGVVHQIREGRFDMKYTN